MPVKILCPDCGASYQVPETNLGRVARCKRCRVEFRLVPQTRAGGPEVSTSSPQPSMADEALPASIGRYQVLRLLGKGGMGTVYLAHDPHLKRDVALKVPHPELSIRAEPRERFFREAQAAARLDHPNFCKIHDIGEVAGVPFLAMAYIEGRTLAASIEAGKPWEARRAAEVVRDLALALDELHRQGFVHRDLKPANVMIDAKGQLIIMDFGLARRVDAADHPTFTLAGSILGTPSYMSPEQADGDVKAIGLATDIYSLGVILYELLSGRLPFDGSPTMVLARILMVEPPPPSEHHPAVDPGLESICLKAMAKEPGARFASMEAFAGALQCWLDGHQGSFPIQTKPSTVEPFPSPILDSTWSLAEPKVPRPSLKRSLVALWLLLAGVGLLAVLALDAANHQEAIKPATPPPMVEPPTLPAPVVTIPTPTPPPSAPDQVVNSIGMKLNLIPAGEFDMGAPDGEPEAEANEKPRHKVRITRPFYLGVYEVTQAEYRQVMGTNPSWFSAEGEGKRRVAGMDTSRHPVENVSSLDAVAFCNKLSGREGLSPCYREDGSLIPASVGYRLPTEAEWEYACRAGTTSAFSFGDRLSPTEANFDGNYSYNGSEKGTYLGRTAAAGSYRKNEFGLFDMHGNVWEWCSDWYDGEYYAQSIVDDPPGASRTSARVVRGGSWNNDPRYCRSADRGGQPDIRHFALGFRVARVRSGGRER